MKAILLLLCLLFGDTAYTQILTMKSQDEKIESSQPPCKPVEVAGVRIVCYQHGVGAFSAEARASAVVERVENLALDPKFDLKTLTVTEHHQSLDIVAGDLVILSLLDYDVDSKSAGDKQQMASVVQKNLVSSIEAHRALSSPTQLLRSASYTVLATLILLLLLFLLSKAYGAIYRFIQSSQDRYIKSIRIQSFEILNAERIIATLMGLARFSRVVLTLLIIYIYLPLVLSFFPWTSNWAPTLFGYILDPLKTIFRVMLGFIPNLFFILAIALVTRYLLKFVHFLFQEVGDGNLQLQGFYKEWASPTYKLVRVLILAFAFIMAFPYLPGSSSPAFQGISVFLGLLLSFGSSSAIANIVAGVVITYMRPFKIGDRVKIADTMGDVIEKNLLVTRIRSIKNVDITVPNSMVLGSHIINYSSTADAEGLVLTTTVTMGYDVPWRRVQEILKEAAKRTDLILKDREPFVLQTALNDFHVAYELNAYTKSPNKMAQIYSDLHQNIQDGFCEASIDMLSPQFIALRDGRDAKAASKAMPDSF